MIELKYKNWNDITIEVYNKIKELKTDENIEDNLLEINIKLLSILCDVDEDTIGDLPLSEFSALVAQTEFLKQMPKYTVESEYKIGDKVFDVQTNLRALTTAQFIDFQTLAKDQDNNTANILACFMLPKGKKYGEDYDVLEVAEYLNKNMSIATARSVMFFFILEYQALQKVMLDYSIKELKKTLKREKNEEAKMKLKESIQQMMQLRDLIKSGTGYSL